MRRGIVYTSSPLLASRTPVWRSKLVVAAMALGFCALAARSAYVQVVDNDFFQRQGTVRFMRTLDLPANRGSIFDRNGVLLASSILASSVWAIPEDVERDTSKLKKLAALLEMPVAELSKKLEKENKNFVWLKRQVDKDVAAQVKALGVKGVYQREEYKRQYPEGAAVAHVVGFTSVEDQGQEGIELAFNDALAGKVGWRRVIKDRLGRVVEDIGEQVAPANGQDIQLSIDSKIQFFVYQKLRDSVIEHKARAGSVVVLDAVTGEILALANYPSFDPNNRQNLTGEQLRNRALTDTFEPGSIMKPFTIGLALDNGLVQPETLINTAPGKITIGRRTLSDLRNYGVLSVEGIIQKSSNVGTTKLAMQMSAKDMWETFSAAGFGHKPDIKFPGAATGRLRPYKNWRPVEQATMSYGYGLSASLFQMARSYTVFAHNGEIIPTTILKQEQAAVGSPIFSEKTANQVRKMLQLAASPGSFGQRAQTAGYSVGGKSGTARKQVGKNYVTDKHRAWFAGMAPIDKPRIVVAVMVDEPSAGVYYGGAVAAPIFSDVVQQTLRILGVQPDMAVKPQIMAADTMVEPL